MPSAKDKTLHQIQQAVMQIVAQNGIGSAGMAEIAKAAKVSSGTLYLHFSSKDDMLQKTYLHLKHDFHDRLMSAEKSLPSAAHIRAMWDNLFAYLQEKPNALLFLEYAGAAQVLTADQTAAIAPLQDHVNTVFQRAIADGTLGQMPVSVAVALLVGTAMPLARRAILGHPPPPIRSRTGLCPRVAKSCRLTSKRNNHLQNHHRHLHRPWPCHCRASRTGGPQGLCHHAHPFQTRRAGHIVTISSVGGLVGQPFNEIYCAAKFAVEGYMESMATYVTPNFGIPFTTVEPGGITSEFAARVLQSVTESGGMYQGEYLPILQNYGAGSATRTASGAYQSADEVATVVMSCIASDAPPIRTRTSAWSEALCDLKTCLDPDGRRMQAKVISEILGG